MRKATAISRMGLSGVACALLVVLGNCKRDEMADQPKVKPLGASAMYQDGAGSRMPPAHTVAIDAPLQIEAASWQSPTTATAFPFVIGRSDLLRGQEQFTIYCTPCHGMLGDGAGMIPQRGFTRPPSYHIERLRNAPPSYFYNVMTNGIGAMFPYSDRIAPDDRWRIAAYIRALQVSQGAAISASTQPGAAAPTAPALTREGAR